MVEPYDSVSVEELQKYAEEAGLGDEYPEDLNQFEKFIKKDNRVLEVGCGTGRLGKNLIKICNYIGIDQHKPYLDYFKDLLLKEKLDPIKYIFFTSFEDFNQKDFDIILFPWTIIGDFSKNKQISTLKKSRDLIKNNGIVILDNPAKETTYNKPKGYHPKKFYFEDWKNKFKKLGFNSFESYTYKTPIGRVREITILRK